MGRIAQAVAERLLPATSTDPELFGNTLTERPLGLPPHRVEDLRIDPNGDQSSGLGA